MVIYLLAMAAFAQPALDEAIATAVSKAREEAKRDVSETGAKMRAAAMDLATAISRHADAARRGKIDPGLREYQFSDDPLQYTFATAEDKRQVVSALADMLRGTPADNVPKGLREVERQATLAIGAYNVAATNLRDTQRPGYIPPLKPFALSVGSVGSIPEWWSHRRGAATAISVTCVQVLGPDSMLVDIRSAENESSAAGSSANERVLVMVRGVNTQSTVEGRMLNMTGQSFFVPHTETHQAPAGAAKTVFVLQPIRPEK